MMYNDYPLQAFCKKAYILPPKQYDEVGTRILSIPVTQWRHCWSEQTGNPAGMWCILYSPSRCQVSLYRIASFCCW